MQKLPGVGDLECRWPGRQRAGLPPLSSTNDVHVSRGLAVPKLAWALQEFRQVQESKPCSRVEFAIRMHVTSGFRVGK